MEPARFYGSSKHVNTIPCNGSVSEDESASDSDSHYVFSHYALHYGRSLIIPETDNDSSDDGEENIKNISPLSRCKKNIKKKQEKIDWKLGNLDPFDENNYKFIGVTELPVYIEELETPADFFLFLFPDNLITLIVEQSNIKALQDNMNEPGSIIKNEMEQFLGIRQRLLLVPKEEFLAVDEQIIPTKCRNQLKQYNPAKPHKWGYKNQVLSGASGFSYDFDIFAGEQSNTSPDGALDLRVSGNVVTRLTGTVPKNMNHKIFFYNWFNNPNLQIHLAKNGILPLGAVRFKFQIQKCQQPKISKSKAVVSLSRKLP
ncbi:hypothetical protein JTB14_021116 [Gonioctena quinquepunctata]|nr:hypothetical protein JTB14_021116 [Gonioctena quinquepunctata]